MTKKMERIILWTWCGIKPGGPRVCCVTGLASGGVVSSSGAVGAWSPQLHGWPWSLLLRYLVCSPRTSLGHLFGRPLVSSYTSYPHYTDAHLQVCLLYPVLLASGLAPMSGLDPPWSGAPSLSLSSSSVLST